MALTDGSYLARIKLNRLDQPYLPGDIVPGSAFRDEAHIIEYLRRGRIDSIGSSGGGSGASAVHLLMTTASPVVVSPGESGSLSGLINPSDPDARLLVVGDAFGLEGSSLADEGLLPSGFVQIGLLLGGNGPNVRLPLHYSFEGSTVGGSAIAGPMIEPHILGTYGAVPSMLYSVDAEYTGLSVTIHNPTGSGGNVTVDWAEIVLSKVG